MEETTLERLHDFATKHLPDKDQGYSAMVLMSFLAGECWHIVEDEDSAECELCGHRFEPATGTSLQILEKIGDKNIGEAER